MTWISRRDVLAAGLGLATLGVAAGCGLPSSSQVVQGLDVGSQILPPVRFQFEPPPRGATPEQIVRGFLAASWASEDDFRAARAYLTAEVAKSWTPRAAVTVYEASSALTVSQASSTPATVTITAIEEARLDGGGRYASRPAGAERTSQIELAHVTGEWRVSRLDPDFGLWLSRYYFERAYRSFSISYVDPTRSEIVADYRWFPIGVGLATTLARAQVESVPGYLTGAVRSGFPAGTRLSVDSVPVSAGRAAIDLSPSVLDVTADDRRAAWAQMVTTLLQVPDVLSVGLQVAGSPLDVGTTTPPTSAESLGFATLAGQSGSPLRRVGDRLQLLQPDGADKTATTNTAALPQIPRAWVDLAVSVNSIEVAGLDVASSLLRRWRAGQSAQYAPFAADLTAPAYDNRKTLWVGGRDSRGSGGVWAIDLRSGSLQAPPRRVTAPWLSGRQILDLRPAPDSQRLLTLSRSPRGAVQIGVSGVVRDSEGRPRSLTAPWAVGGDVVAATRASWVDNTALAVIGRIASGSSLRPLVVQVGGPTQELASVSDPRSIVSTGGERGIVVVSGDGAAYGRVGGGWQSIGRIDDVIIPAG